MTRAKSLLALAREKLEIFLSDSDFEAFKWPRVEAGLDDALAFEMARRELGVEIHVEESGAWSFELADGSMFRLTGVADRIEVNGDGTATVFDYKTGAPPSNKQVLTGFAPQLTLEAAMIAAGAFENDRTPRHAGRRLCADWRRGRWRTALGQAEGYEFWRTRRRT